MLYISKMVRISSGNKYLNKNIQRAKQASRIVSCNVKNTAKYYNNNFSTGWQTGERLAKIRQYNSTKLLGTKIIGAISKTKIKQEHLPAILGGIGLITPVPGASLIGFGLGKLINKLSKFIK